jgi:hypothetical protein
MKPSEQQLRQQVKSRILCPRHFPCKVAIVLIKMNECAWIISPCILFPNSCEHKNWTCFSRERKRIGFEPGLFFGDSERISTFEMTVGILCLIATDLVAQLKYAFYNLVHTTSFKKLQNKNVYLSYSSSLHAPMFPLMLIVTRFIQSVITVSTCCELSSR